jgi:hypothetical protein
MKGAEGSKDTIAVRAKIIVAVVTGLFFAAALVVAPRSAEAKPEYAAKEGKACGFCHKNPAGGGERNAKGKQYEAKGHTFKK